MINNKLRLYWTLQITGWAFYGIIEAVTSVLASRDSPLTSARIIFFFYEAFFCLLVSHGYRYFINRSKWFSLGMARLPPRVLLTVFGLGILIYFLRIPVAIPLGLFNNNRAFDP